MAAKMSSSIGTVPGRYRPEKLVCQYAHMTNSKGRLWFGGDLFDYSVPTLMFHIVLFFLLTRTSHSFLKPLRQSMLSSQVIAGMILGPTFLPREKTVVQRLFPPGAKLILETLANIGFMFHLFLLGVQIDTALLWRAGKTAVLIGTTGFAVPLAFGVLAIFVSHHIVVMDPNLSRFLPFIAAMNSMTSFPVITSLLTDLNILNSELGRLASLTSMVSDLWSYSMALTMTTVGISMRDSQWTTMKSVAWVLVYMMVIGLVVRPVVLRMARQTRVGEPMKEEHYLLIIVAVLLSGLFSEILGQHVGLGSFLLGLAIPDGPPLGSSLVNRLDVMSTRFLLPIKMSLIGVRVNLRTKDGTRASGVVTGLTIISGYVGKFTGTLLAALYGKVPFWDAICLALIMCCKGVVETYTYYMCRDDGIVDNQAYALLVVTMLIVTGTARLLIGHLYDPSKRYMTQRRNTNSVLLSNAQNLELRVLVCVHNEDNVPTIINLLEASNPTRHRPITVYVLNLMELTGRAAAILVPNFKRSKLSSLPCRSDQIVNAFDHFVRRNHGRVVAQHFTAVAPYASMHDDICTLALDKSASLVIVPFHKQWTIDGSVGATFPSIRTVNKNVIKKAPCSVAVLVDRGQISGNWSVLTGKQLFRVALLFLGGTDDREALAFGSRMACHPRITLTVVWIRPQPDHECSESKMEENLDRELMDGFRSSTAGNERIIFRDETVIDGVGTTRIIRSMEDSFDLFIVGRHHEASSPLTSGLTEWNECPELGVIGDLLATSEFQFSLLVVQQQPLDADYAANLNWPVASTRLVDTRVLHQQAFNIVSEHPMRSSVSK